MATEIPDTGSVYRHKNGTHYRVIGTAMHSESHEPLVLYRERDNGSAILWARPAVMFMEPDRFQLVSRGARNDRSVRR